MKYKLKNQILEGISAPAWTVCAEIEVVYKTTVKASQRPEITNSLDAYNLLLANWDIFKLDYCEQFKVLFLNRANRVLGLLSASSGGITGTVADPKLIIGAALTRAACGIIITHNHPSGSLKTSRADEELTQKIKMGCSYVDIKLIDHMIVTSEGYFSFADEGLL
jgi:DNA repair protein RadC